MKKLFHLSDLKLSNEAVDGLINLCETVPSVAAKFDNEILARARLSEISWLPKDTPAFQPVYDFLNIVFAEANGIFQVDIIENSFPIQYTKYHGSSQGHYDFHSDVHWPSPTDRDRKLSFVMQLSDPSEYTGGQFEFTHIQDFPTAKFAAKGSILVFPSALFHRVTPVTEGTRRSLVSWIEGPCWR
jgi:PKHD-type hydroxylase